MFPRLATANIAAFLNLNDEKAGKTLWKTLPFLILKCVLSAWTYPVWNRPSKTNRFRIQPKHPDPQPWIKYTGIFEENVSIIMNLCFFFLVVASILVTVCPWGLVHNHTADRYIKMTSWTFSIGPCNVGQIVIFCAGGVWTLMDAQFIWWIT